MKRIENKLASEIPMNSVPIECRIVTRKDVDMWDEVGLELELEVEKGIEIRFSPARPS